MTSSLAQALRVAMVSSAVALAACHADTVTPGHCSVSEARDCEDAKRSAQAMVDASAACSPGDACKVISAAEVTIPCTGIYCSVAVNSRTDEAAFLARARLLQEQARSCSACGLVCPMPLCANPGQLTARCDTAARRCVLGQ